ncbi:4'-phosphopantetheinyl transferase superfamily protein [Saccharopolyspora karakumensis]|uniref:4'-phosphopantetheinyl transferase superfamily protein n=1 Tax=Saccharopolyspora karakumensis TaxID=2530386 RepID=A0A4V2YW85_9PSEU|nr:4'-phosphopantetheinyl transferase superfamily protein [Saccharopolyspora karakumensis]TDD84437.1 4'-phosphopantetheinyl transferase superfamily protein [Saccharopolyspora karakumensis]
MIEELLPAVVATAETFDDPPEATLFDAEAVEIEKAVAKRRREFTSGRWCAHRAMRALGVAPVPLLRGERGAPQWPAEAVGSITHCLGYRGAAVARRHEIRSVGIDAEQHEPLPDGVLDVVSRPEEREHIAELSARDPGTCWDRILFSCKESVYKTWYPVTGEWLGFEDAELEFGAGSFTARLRKSAGGLTGFSGRWLVRDGLVLSAIALEG